MTALDLLTQVREAGGRVWLEAAALHYRLPIKQQRLWLQELRTHKAEIFQHLLEQEPRPSSGPLVPAARKLFRTSATIRRLSPAAQC